MKKIFLLLFLFIVAVCSAQRKDLNMDHENFFRFGAKAGININKISGQAYKQGFRFNFQVGGFLQFNFSDRFGIQPEASFVQSTSEFTNDATDVYDDLFRDGGQRKATLNYLEVPLLLNVNVGPSKRIKLQAGPVYGAVLKQTVDSLRSSGNLYKNSDWSILGGLWIQVPFINLGARYKLGLTNINAVDNRQSWKNQSIQVFIGVTF